MRLTGVALAAAGLLLVVSAAPALAHERTTVVIVRPGADARVDRLFLELRGQGGSGAARFTVLLDGRVVDSAGRTDVTSIFTEHDVTPGGRLRLDIRAEPGEHEIRVRYTPDVDDSKPDVVRRVTVRQATEPGGPRLALLAVIGVAAGLVVTAVAHRRRTRHSRG